MPAYLSPLAIEEEVRWKESGGVLGCVHSTLLGIRVGPALPVWLGDRPENIFIPQHKWEGKFN